MSMGSPPIAKAGTALSSKFGIATATDILHQEQQPTVDVMRPNSRTAMTDVEHHGVDGPGSVPSETQVSRCSSSGYSIVRHLFQLQQVQKQRQYQRHQYAY